MLVLLASAGIALLVSLFATPLFIRGFSRIGWGQFIRDDGPQSHHVKRGTPTMGGLVFIVDATGCKFNGNTVDNSPEKPGYVVIARGTPTLNGTADFYGVIYHANEDEKSGTLINLTGNISVVGSIVIDGAGGLSAGSSKINLIYNPNVFAGLTAFGTAGIVQNTFREISGV